MPKQNEGEPAMPLIAPPPPARLASISSMLPLLGHKRDALAAKVSQIVAHSQNSERRDWETPAGLITTPPPSAVTGIRPQGRQVHWNNKQPSPLPSPALALASPGLASKGWSIPFGGYFGAKGNVPALRQEGEQQVSCFPGVSTSPLAIQFITLTFISFVELQYATLRPSPNTEPSLVLEVTASGSAFRLRPISQAPSAQRILYSVAKSLASLPKVSASNPSGALTPDTPTPDSETIPDPNSPSLDALLAQPGNEAGGSKAALFEALLRQGQQSEEPEEMEESELPLADLSAVAHLGTTPETELNLDVERLRATEAEEPSLNLNPPHLSRRPKIISQASLQDQPPPKRSITTPPSSRPHSMVSSRLNPSGSTSPRGGSSRSSSPTRLPSNSTLTSSHSTSNSPNSTFATSHSSTTPHSTAPQLLPTHHHHDWPKPFTYTESDLPRLHRNLSERLLPFFGKKLVNRKVRLSVWPVESGLWDKPLGEKIVTTSSTGGFKTSFEVREGGLKRFLEDDRCGSLEQMRIKVVAELLEEEGVGEPTFDLGERAKVERLRTVAQEETTLRVGRDGTVRVISDIDDTVKVSCGNIPSSFPEHGSNSFLDRFRKHTQVTSGTKTIFRNVFCRELDEIAVPGMADWYQGMVEEGATIHYVSNSPNELWPVVRQYLSSAGYPSGSVTLKEYGGASSAIAKLWEEPGVRKRAGVENILKNFPDCKYVILPFLQTLAVF